MNEKAWLDLSVFRCPRCGRYYVDASWYAVELEADTECGNCRTVFNTKKQQVDRVMLMFKIDKRGQMMEAEITEHISFQK